MNCIINNNFWKIFKTKGLEYYVYAYNKEDAVSILLLNRIGVTKKDVEEVQSVSNNYVKVFNKPIDLKDVEL